jgi:DNA-binding NtrC family response regulator
VLVADSDDGARRPCADYLGRFRFNVAEAVDGEDLMARIVIAPPRIILAEARLPSLPPHRLVQWLRDSVWTRHIPVILMVHETDAELAADAPRTTGTLFKPFSLDAMLNEVRRLLRIEIAGRNQSDRIRTSYSPAGPEFETPFGR